MSNMVASTFNIMLYLLEGYCIQFLFRAFAEPKLQNWKVSKYIVGVAWIVIRK